MMTPSRYLRVRHPLPPNAPLPSLTCRHVFQRTGRDMKACVQLIRQGNKQLFLSSVERFSAAQSDGARTNRSSAVTKVRGAAASVACSRIVLCCSCGRGVPRGASLPSYHPPTLAPLTHSLPPSLPTSFHSKLSDAARTPVFQAPVPPLTMPPQRPRLQLQQRMHWRDSAPTTSPSVWRT